MLCVSSEFTLSRTSLEIDLTCVVKICDTRFLSIKAILCRLTSDDHFPLGNDL